MTLQHISINDYFTWRLKQPVVQVILQKVFCEDLNILTPITGEFPSQSPVTRSFDVFFDLRLNKRLSKQS